MGLETEDVSLETKRVWTLMVEATNVRPPMAGASARFMNQPSVPIGRLSLIPRFVVWL